MEFDRVELVQPRYGTVNAYRVGNTLVDTGHLNTASTRRLRGKLDGIDRVIVTHPHIDHVGASLTVDAVTELPHVVFEGAEETLRNYDRYVREARQEQVTLATEGDTKGTPDDEYFPIDVDYAGTDLRIDRVVGHGDTIEVGPYTCTVVHTPGHARQHMSLYHPDSGVMLSGDIVSRNGHYMFGAVQWDVGEYHLGLRRVRNCEPDTLCPGHGPVMTDAMARIEDAMAKADRAEREIIKIVESAGPIGSRTLARRAFDATAETVDFLANVAAAYAIHLADKGRVCVDRHPTFEVRPS